MTRYHSILFDLDGTLLDSRKSVIQATYETACKFLPERLSYEDINARFGEPFSEFVSFVGLEAQADELLAYYMAQVEKNHDRLVRPYPFVIEGIALLREKYQLAIVTNKERRLVMRGLNHFGLSDAFDVIVCIDDVQHGKPSAEPILKAISLLGSTPDRCLMVGDTIFDVMAAENAGVDCALLRYEESGLAEQAVTYEFYKFQDLVNFLITEKNPSMLTDVRSIPQMS
ncbi:pyrophosphatase PpaX [Collibacillus ludicampi]|jgi:pyrophosphatase PpaX|uniref:Pyrophosphatase PpaX n=1 Tax=Collibacillus ludicampi TaxID=2771369 RepID=A0AAV4LD67_9BACL|nr:HAD-IA family hydrolase [Collibacillus ludicampi]GIM45603.1 pyrophosphatase PpaX [Collibacillus ludicampi]